MLPEKKRILVVVRTYPTPAQKGLEVSCTAGVTDDGKWIRLFPVPYRLLEEDQRFAKYHWIDVDVTKASDPRPESYNLNIESIRIASPLLPPDNQWQARKNIVFPLKAHCLCCLKGKRDADGYPTLGIFRPKRIKRLLMETDAQDWNQAQLDRLHQFDMFREMPREQLEKVPFKFKYEFFCDEDACSGHTMMCTDWEMGESWRKWKQKYGEKWKAKFRQKYEQEMINDRETYFCVGTLSDHPAEWIIVGLFYPPHPPELPLFRGLTA